MKAILSLINKYFWKGIVGPVFSFAIPIILFVFMGRILGPSLVVPGLFLIPPMCILLIFMPQSIFEFRNSSLLKRIGTTPIKPFKFLLGISIFNLIIVICSFILVFLLGFLVFIDSENTTNSILGIFSYENLSYINLIKQADWLSFLFFYFQLIIICLLIGLFIASIAKSTLFVQCTGIAITLISLFIGPAVLPIAVASNTEIVKWMGYFLPLKYSIGSSIESFTSNTQNLISNLTQSSPWDINSPLYSIDIFLLQNIGAPNLLQTLKVEVFSKADKILNLVIPWIFIVGFGYLVAATFKWNNRGSNKINWRVITKLLTIIKSKKLQNNNVKGDENSKYILQIENLTKKFKVKDTTIIANNNISFNIEKGRNLAIIGHNGAGKSVLIETILGINLIDEGKIIYNFDYKKSFNEKIGIQFQDSSYPFGITVKDLIDFFIESYNLSISEQELNEMINIFGVNEYINKNASSLSGGQQQRINLLLSVIHQPKILFLDELSNNLDIKIRNDIKAFIKEFAKKNNITIVIISHDMNEVEYLADDIIVLKSGSIAYHDTKENIIHEHKNLENFIYEFLK